MDTVPEGDPILIHFMHNIWGLFWHPHDKIIESKGGKSRSRIIAMQLEGLEMSDN